MAILPLFLWVNITEQIFVPGIGMQAGDHITLSTVNDHLAAVDWNSTYQLTEDHVQKNKFEGKMRVTGKFLGRTNVEVRSRRGGETFPVNGTLPVIVLRPERVIDTIFVTSVVTFELNWSLAKLLQHA